MNDGEPFHGYENRDCGDHRTVGAHRAWCFDCSEWCYPKTPCRGCEPSLGLALSLADCAEGVALWNLDTIEGDERVAFLGIVTRDGRPVQVMVWDEDGEAVTLWEA